MNDDDQALLERYRQDECESAFARLVERHIDMVWAAACRITEDADLAKDVAQGVFTALARKARSSSFAANVAGWLYRATTMEARKALRTNRRRAHREREAMENHLPAPGSDSATVEALMPLLDEGLQKLGEQDRDIVVLRFFARKSLSDIGAALAISEAAAQKRVSRAVEKLRGYFGRQGHLVPAATVLSALTAAGVAAAPAGIASAIAGTSCALAASMGAAGTAGFGAAALEQIIAMKSKILIASAAMIAVGTPLLFQQQTLASLERNLATTVAATQNLENLRAQEAQLAAQRQVLADWEQMERDREELLRLRAEASRLASSGVDPAWQQALAAARANRDSAQLSARIASDTVQAEQLRVMTVEAMKQLGLAARIYATDNEERFPKLFEDMKNELSNGLPGNMSLERFEFMPHERVISELEPEMILFREKEARKMPDGTWNRAYTMADGSVQQRNSPTPDFTEWEKEHTARADQQVAR